MESFAWIKDVITLLPIAGLIWKAATSASKIKELDEKYRECKARVDSLATDSDRNMERVLSELGVIQQSIARLETKLEERTGK